MNNNVIVELFDEDPSLTSVAVIVIVGGVLSYVTLPDPLVTAVPWLPYKSANAIEKVTDPLESFELPV